MKNKISISILSALLVLLGQVPLSAQATVDPNFYDRFLANGLLLFAGLVILGAVLAIFRLLNVVVQMQQIQIYQEKGIEAYVKKVKEPKEPLWRRLYKRWTNVVPIEKEEDIMFDHSFDGIRELDNSLPPWWVAMFYMTIVIGVVYFGYHHVLGYGQSTAERYEAQMERAEEQVQAYLASQANLVDETNVAPLEDEGQLALGKSIYDANCLACHGAFGEGGVGPNLTDAYWIHGGSIKDVFSTIKYGVPEKGMIAWQSQLRASEMQQVASYIMTMQGTNPPNAKEPQGELFEAESVIEAADTSAENTVIGMLEKE
ncbi:MAG TPA: cbb3-type cytochrome c oxidase N-terminal domain-containing protein [Saprospiraceae bacterium]|nr:cbb3-type cytochrome c oxidase N-terminal domain-containing protein [Saprospiraceae bacterium]